jgi:hypothetical protein
MAVQKDPNVVAQKMVSRAQAAAGDYANGVKAVTDSPTAAAAKALDKAKLNYNAAIDSGKTAARLNAVSTQDWINATITKGAPRYSTGVQAALPKLQKFFAQSLPYIANLQQTISKMPSVTLADNIQRMVANAQGMANFKYQP